MDRKKVFTPDEVGLAFGIVSALDPTDDRWSNEAKSLIYKVKDLREGENFKLRR